MSAKTTLYPPTPSGIPPELTTPSPRYRLLVVVVLISLILFVLLYLALVAGSAYLVYWSFTYPLGTGRGVILLKLGAIAGSIMLFLFLLKGLFKRQKVDKSQDVLLKEKDYPELYAFVRQLCRDTKAPFPRKIYVSPDVNAAVFYDTSLLSLIFPVRKNLLIGLGLVNMLNLNEFKAVLAHEFGHFSQRSMKLGTYVYTANGIITDLVYGRDSWDEILKQWRYLDLRISFPAWAISGVVWVLRKFLAGVFRLINLGNLALSRQMEFNADLVAVSVTGSDALIHALSKLDFANQALMQTVRELQDASDHNIFSADVFYHQSEAAKFLRTVRKDAKLGLPPELPADPGQRVQVFQPGEGAPPSMWSTHPSNYDREENAKRTYIRSLEDDRPAWLLFPQRQQLCAEVSERLYRMWMDSAKIGRLSPPEQVQTFIDDERAEMTYDPRYHGVYDGRYIEPGDLDTLLREPVLAQEELSHRHANLYGGELETLMEQYRNRQGDYFQLLSYRLGYEPMTGKQFNFREQTYRQADLENLLQLVNEELEGDRRWQSQLDKKVFLTFYHMARHLGAGLETDLLDRYTFHLGVQEMGNRLGQQKTNVEGLLQYLSTTQDLTPDDMKSVLASFIDAHSGLYDSLRQASKMFLPRMRNMVEGQPLDRFLLEEPLIEGLHIDDMSIEGRWISEFIKQLALVIDRLGRIHAKSMGGILALQEKIGAEWEKAQQQEAAPVQQARESTVASD